MSRRLFKLRKKLTETVDTYIWSAMFLVVYFGVIAAVIAILYSFQ